MKEIQTACADLARHPESYVGRLAGLIAELDTKRDREHENRIVERDAQISTQSAELKVVKADNRLLRARLNKLQDMQFGQKSEQSSTASTTPEPTEIPKPNHTSKPSSDYRRADATKPRGMRGRQKISIPENVPRDIRIIEPETGSTCSCGCDMRPLGEQVIERLTFVPAQLRVIEEHYPKYVCRTCDKFVQAPVPKRAFEQTRFDDQLIAGLAVSKFADFIPNYRQEQIFKRSGVRLHRSSMIRMMNSATDALWPVFEALERDLKSSSKLYMDETVLAQLDPGNGKTKTCYVWALCRDDRRWNGNENPGVVFHFKQSRHGLHAGKILQGFNGTLQVDGYSGYNRLTHSEREGGPLTLAYCWAHVRRKFLDEHKANKSKAAFEIMEMINRIYGIERDMIATNHINANTRRVIRQTEAAPLIASLFARLKQLATQTSRKSSLGKAISYSLKLERGLQVFLNDGRVEFDSNAVENTIRPIALLRKNALFAGSEVGGRNWAVMASIIGTCRINGVEPYAYLTWVFEQMANGHPRSKYNELLPWNCPHGKFAIE